MDARRLAYLKALDVDVWERRDRPAVAPMEASPGVREPSAAADLRTWDELAAAVETGTRCALHATRTRPVFGVGSRTAQWMVIGEAPGGDEDRQGEPFVGRAGQLLNSMLKAIGLQREEVFIANIL